jgi:hypothetical protein
MRSSLRSALLVGALVSAVPLPTLAGPIFANNPAPGDSFTNPGPANQGQAVVDGQVGSTGWYYNNVRNGATVGIKTTLPRDGNGSAFFSSPDRAGKADIEYLAQAVNLGGNFFANGSLGRFAEFKKLQYDWYRVGTSTNPTVQHPAARILLDADGDLSTLSDRGGLVFERAYNSMPTLTDQWITDVVNVNTYVWNFGLGLGSLYDLDGNSNPYDSTVANWQAVLQNAVILGFSFGVGSGWNGAFYGAVDNIGWGIGQDEDTFPLTNFEVRGTGTTPVPEPASLSLLGLGLAGLGLARRRRA